MKQAMRASLQAVNVALNRRRRWKQATDERPRMPPVLLPAGFDVHTGNIGIKDPTADVMLLRCTRGPAAVAGVLTQSLFAGPSVTLTRERLASGTARALLVLSKNSNVATGAAGDAEAAEVTELAAQVVGCEADDVLVASTGVIGVRYPMPRIRAYFADLADPTPGDYPIHHDAVAAAEAMMTTDTHPKVAQAVVAQSGAESAARVVGIAKGVGMIEPNMATMIAAITTDAQLSSAELDAVFKEVVATTFNALSVDGDTSTSDTALLMASGAAGPVDPDAFATALHSVCLDLTRQLAADGEGASKLLVVTVRGAEDQAQAKRVAKSIVNSPLVKTAVAGADPNWGRVAMAIGKCESDTSIDQTRVTISFGDAQLYPTAPSSAGRSDGVDGAGATPTDAPVSAELLAQLADYLAGDEVEINVDLGVRADGASFTAYGCDLTDGYVRINADYTT